MLKEHSQIFITILFISDLILIAFSWILAYLIRFNLPLIKVVKDIPPWEQHLPLLLLLILICSVVFNLMNLYRPMRFSSISKEVKELFKAITISLLLFIFFAYFFKEYRYSRLTILYFWVIGFLNLSLARWISRRILRFLRKKGKNLRYVLLVGEGKLLEKLLRAIHRHPELGLKPVGILSEKGNPIDKTIDGVDVIGSYDDLPEIVKKRGVDKVFIVLPFHRHEKIKDLLVSLKDEFVDIKIVSDLYDLFQLRGGIEEIDGLPIINIRETPLLGWGKIFKRVIDVLISSIGLLLLSPFFLLISLLIKITSKGPVFYKQKRMGLDGNIFEIIKFRSMIVDAENNTGSVWAKEDDPRRTPLGKILRRTSLDELPQLWNVLKGEMSLVGPRPERPELIERFKEVIPNYMLRHKIKAGMTGWAQVNGWRGNSSIEKRIEHDIYYIEHWSIAFDIKILFLTLFKGFINRNAY
ncbi:MAG: undecaprenyl-phosphate glucose phosphotransferase [Thermodesulfobacteriota bacterium]